MMLNRTLGLSLIVLALTLVAGCASKGEVGMDSIHGTWELAPGQPPSKVTIASMTLSEDGKYNAVATYGPKSEEMAGTYTYEAGKLTFDSNGSKRVYPVTYSGDEMMVTHGATTVKMLRKN